MSVESEEKENPEEKAGGSALDDELAALEAEAAPDQSVIEAEKKQAEEKKQLVSAKDEYYGVFKMALSPLPPILCPNWGIQSAEVDALCEAYALACARQWPGGIGDVGPWMGAAITTLAIVGPRLAIPPRSKPEKAGEKAGGGNGSASDSER